MELLVPATSGITFDLLHFFPFYNLKVTQTKDLDGRGAKPHRSRTVFRLGTHVHCLEFGRRIPNQPHPDHWPKDAICLEKRWNIEEATTNHDESVLWFSADDRPPRSRMLAEDRRVNFSTSVTRELVWWWFPATPLKEPRRIRDIIPVNCCNRLSAAQLPSIFPSFELFETTNQPFGYMHKFNICLRFDLIEIIYILQMKIML